MDAHKRHSVKIKKSSTKPSSRHNTSKCSLDTLPKSPKPRIYAQNVSHRSKSPQNSTISISTPKEPIQSVQRPKYESLNVHLPLHKMKRDITQEPWSLSSTGDNIGEVPVKLLSYDRQPYGLVHVPNTPPHSTARDPRPAALQPRVCPPTVPIGPVKASGSRSSSKARDDSPSCRKMPRRAARECALDTSKLGRSSRSFSASCAGLFGHLDDNIEAKDSPIQPGNQGLTFAENYHSQLKYEQEQFSPHIAENRRFIDIVTECLCKMFSKGLSHESQRLTQKVLDSLKSGELNFFRSTFTEYLDFLRLRDVCQTHQIQQTQTLQNEIERLMAYTHKVQRTLAELVDLAKVIASPVCDKPIAMYTKRIELGRKVAEIEQAGFTQKGASKNLVRENCQANLENIDPQLGWPYHQEQFDSKLKCRLEPSLQVNPRLADPTPPYQLPRESNFPRYTPPAPNTNTNRYDSHYR